MITLFPTPPHGICRTNLAQHFIPDVHQQTRVTEMWENKQPLWPRQNCVGIVCSRSLKPQYMTISTYRDASKIPQCLTLTKVSTIAVFPLPLLLYTLLHRTDFHFRWKISEKLFSTWKFLHCLFLSHCFQHSGSWGQPRFLWKHHNQNYTVPSTVQLQGLNW